MPELDKRQLRKTLRQRRRNLTRQQQKIAALHLARQMSRLGEFRNARRLAAYLPNDGEISLQPLLELAWRMNKEVYLPVLHPCRRGLLLFVRHVKGQVLARNRYGIPEPLFQHGHRSQPWALDLVLAPLVGFDEKGHRMGMGGGFYDRTFAYLSETAGRRDAGHQKPRLIGVAHECQKVDDLPFEHWDIPMSRIVTDEQVYVCQTG